MKKYLFITAALLAAVCSCQKEGPSKVSVLDEQLSTKPIRFGVMGLNANVRTKALTETVLASLADGFNVTALSADSTSYFQNQKAVSKGDIDNGKQLFGVDNWYWPTTGTLSFFGVFPATGYSLTNSPKGTVSFPVGTAQAAFDGKKDIVAARAIDAANQTEQVALQFGHVLNWVHDISFLVGDANATYRIDSVAIKAPSYGTYTFAADSLGAWGSLGADKNYVLFNKAGGQTLTAGAKTTAESIAAADFDDVAVIANGACELCVKYTVTINGASNSFTKHADIDLWQGKKSSISATLSNDLTPIQFLVSVKAWDPNEIIATLE